LPLHLQFQFPLGSHTQVTVYTLLRPTVRLGYTYTQHGLPPFPRFVVPHTTHTLLPTGRFYTPHTHTHTHTPTRLRCHVTVLGFWFTLGYRLHTVGSTGSPYGLHVHTPLQFTHTVYGYRRIHTRVGYTHGCVAACYHPHLGFTALQRAHGFWFTGSPHCGCAHFLPHARVRCAAWFATVLPPAARLRAGCATPLPPTRVPVLHTLARVYTTHTGLHACSVLPTPHVYVLVTVYHTVGSVRALHLQVCARCRAVTPRALRLHVYARTLSGYTFSWLWVHRDPHTRLVGLGFTLHCTRFPLVTTRFTLQFICGSLVTHVHTRVYTYTLHLGSRFPTHPHTHAHTYTHTGLVCGHAPHGLHIWFCTHTPHTHTHRTLVAHFTHALPHAFTHARTHTQFTHSLVY